MTAPLRGRFFFAALVCTAALLGCKVGPDYTAPEPDAPEEWRNESERFATDEVRRPSWWRHLDDPVLESLVRDAEGENIGVKVAVQRIEEAKAQYGVTRSGLWPNLDAVASYRRARSSRNGTNNRVAGFQFQDRDLWSVGGEMNWEIDLWGNVRRGMEAATAEVEASVEDLRDVIVLLQAEVVRTYIELRSLQERVTILEANIAVQEASAQQAQTRRDAGVAPEIDVSQSQTQLASTRAQLPETKILLEAALNRLATLLGQRPGSLHGRLALEQAIPAVPSTLRVPVPADYLRQRPDVRAAERRLAAASARIGVRSGDLYPRLSIFGSFNWESTSTGNLTSSNSEAFTVGPFVRWNLFSAGRVLNSIDVEAARTNQALRTFEETVLRALAEVEDSMFADTQQRERLAFLETAVTQARRSVELVQTLYQNGLADYVRVLEAQGARLSLEVLHAQTRAQLAINFVRLYRALGGGWIVPMPDADVER